MTRTWLTEAVLKKLTDICDIEYY